MAEAAVNSPSPAGSSLAKEGLSPEANRPFIQKLPTYQGHENKANIFNNGDANGIHYAVPFQLREGSQESALGGSQLAFSVDPKHPDSFIIAEDNRHAGNQSLVLEERADQLFLRLGDRPLNIYQGNMKRGALTGADFANHSVVVPMTPEFALAIVGFKPDKREVIVQKVRPAKDSQPLHPPRLVDTELPEDGSGFLETGSYYQPRRVNPEFQMAKDFPRVVNSRVGQAEIGRSASGQTSPVGAGLESSSASEIKWPRFPDVLTADSADGPTLETGKSLKERGELLRKINILKNTGWGKEVAAVVGGLALISLLSWALDRTAKVPNVPAVPTSGLTSELEVPKITPHVIPPTPEVPQEPATVLATNLKGQSTWGMFLHDLGRLDASAIEKSFPGGIPDNVRSAWEAVREVEAQTGQSIRPDDPILLNAVSAATDFLSKEKVGAFYDGFVADIEKNNPGAGTYLVDSTPKTDARYGTRIIDHRINTDSLRMHNLEDIINKAAAGKGSV